MFDVRFMVDDRKLADALWALDGIAIGMPDIRPVRGAKVQNGKVVAVARDATIKDSVARAIVKMGLDRVDLKKMRTILESLGSKPSNAGAMLRQLRDVGFLLVPKGHKPSPSNPTNYIVNAGKSKPAPKANKE